MEKNVIAISINEAKCDLSKYNSSEIKSLKKKFLNKEPIPCPQVNKKKEITAFYNSYFALKELKVPKIIVVLPQ